MRGSVLAKMIGLYMLMVFMFLGVVGSVLLEACRKEISDVRIELLSSRASAVVKMADRKSTRLNSSHDRQSRMPSSA